MALKRISPNKLLMMPSENTVSLANNSWSVPHKFPKHFHNCGISRIERSVELDHICMVRIDWDFSLS